MLSLSKRRVELVLAAAAVLFTACESGGSGGANETTASEPASTATPAPAPEPAAPVVDEPLVAVVAERLPYAEVDNQLVYGHFVFPADMVDPLPAVLLIHEAWGLNDHVRAVADRLAGEGYIVLAVDLFEGSSTTNLEQARQQILKVVENPESARENIRQAYGFVGDTAGAPRVGSMGWDFGGGWSLNTAMLFPEGLDAAVVVYGQVTDDEDALRPIGAPILGLFAGRDRSISPDSVKSFEETLERLRKNYTIHIYPNADHSFADPASGAFNQDTAEDAWQKTLEFLSLHLKINDSESP